MSKFGGGGAKCTICDKTAYPAETIQYEKLPYHVECFRCKDCNKKMEGPSKAKKYEDSIYCEHCFSKNGFAQKQKKVVWTKKTGTSAVSSKFGGGGNPCTICEKTVYPAEALSFEKKIYHQGCFKCAECSKKMTSSDAAAYEDQVFCRKCFSAGGYNRKQAQTANKAGGGTSSGSSAIASKFGGGGVKCQICEKTVYSAEQVSYEKLAYHSDCFKCSVETCNKKMTPSGAAKFEGQLYCTKCFDVGGFRQKQASTAKKATGSGTSNAMASKFGGGGTKCYVCEKTVYPAELVSFEKNAFHSECFKCKHCSKKLTTSTAEGKKLEGGGVDAYCKKCWGELGLNRATIN